MYIYFLMIRPLISMQPFLHQLDFLQLYLATSKPVTKNEGLGISSTTFIGNKWKIKSKELPELFTENVKS